MTSRPTWRADGDPDVDLLRACLAVPEFLTVAGAGQRIEVMTGRSSPLYMSVKALWQHSALMASLDEGLFNLNSDRNWDVVLGVPCGGTPHAVVLARRLAAPLVLWRTIPRRGDPLAGCIPDGARSALVVEDVLATGSSAAPALAALRAAVSLVRLTAVFSYGLDPLIADAQSVEVTSLFTVDRVLDLLEENARARLASPYADFRDRLTAEALAVGG